MSEFPDRRSMLKYGALGLVGGSAVFTASAETDETDDSDLSVRLEAQETEGKSVVLEDLATKRASVLFVTTAAFEVVGREQLPGDVERESRVVELDQPLTESGPLHAVLFERNGKHVTGDTAMVTLDKGLADLTVDDQTSDGDSVEISHLRTDVDASAFVFDENGQEIGGSGITFDGGDEVESLTVPLDEPLSTSQTIRVTLYESNGGPIAEDTADITVEDGNPADLTIDDQTTDGDSVEIAYLRTDVDASVFVLDEGDETIGGSGITFDGGDEVESLTVPLDEPLSTSQSVSVLLYESNGGPIAEDTADITVDEDDNDAPVDLTIDDQTSDGSSIEISHLRTDVDASAFVFDENGQEIGGSGVTFDAGDETESLTVDLYEPLSTSQAVRVTLYESNSGPITEDTAHVEIE